MLRFWSLNHQACTHIIHTHTHTHTHMYTYTQGTVNDSVTHKDVLNQSIEVTGTPVISKTPAEAWKSPDDDKVPDTYQIDLSKLLFIIRHSIYSLVNIPCIKVNL